MTRWLCALTLLLTACNGDTTKDTDTTDATDTPSGTTGDTGGTTPFDAYADADLTDPAVVAELASTLSAPNAYGVGVTQLILADLSGSKTCPAVTVKGDTTTYTGGCTDDDGTTWTGTATSIESKAKKKLGGSITYVDFGFSGESACDGKTKMTVSAGQTIDGTVTVDAKGGFTIDVVAEGAEADTKACTSNAFDYRLEYSGSIADTSKSAETWNGQGRFGDSRIGQVMAATVNEVIDEKACDTEAASGTTTLTADGHTAVITYDGATDCDKTSTVTWTLDGKDQGELSGISCSTSPLRASGLLVLLGLLGLRRRRSP